MRPDEIARPPVYEFEDYRLYLKAMAEYLRQKKGLAFSHRIFLKKAGFRSSNFLSLVIKGKSNLSTKAISRFSEALELNQQEAHFFKHLVMMNQEKGFEKKSVHAKALVQSRLYRKVHPLTQTHYRLYSHWYYIPIFEILSLKNAPQDLHGISRRVRPQLTLAQADQALRDLRRLGLIRKNSEGRWEQSRSTIRTPSEVFSTMIAEYHQVMMKKACDAIDTIDRKNRDISAVTISIPSSQVEKFKSHIQKFRQEMLGMSRNSGDADVVFQLNMQLFPVSQAES